MSGCLINPEQGQKKDSDDYTTHAHHSRQSDQPSLHRGGVVPALGGLRVSDAGCVLVMLVVYACWYLLGYNWGRVRDITVLLKTSECGL